jgi:hypothetical protein
MYSPRQPNISLRQIVSLTLLLVFWTNIVCGAGRTGTAGQTKPKREAEHQGSHVVDLLRQQTARVARPDAEADKSHAGGGAPASRVSETYGRLPLRFEANEGQTDGQVKFLARANGYSLFLTPGEAVMVLGRRTGGAPGSKDGRKAKPARNKESASAVLRMRLKDANPRPNVVGLDELSGKSNYLIGNDPGKWQIGVSNFEKVKYEQMYPGVDVVYYGNNRLLEHDFVLAPGADVRAIKLNFEGARGLRVDKAGDLVLRVNGGELRQSKPLAYQEVAGRRQTVTSRYALNGKDVGFEVGEYDRSKPLVIDPVLVYSSYLGGSGNDISNSITVDAAGNAYLTGTTASTNFPTLNPRQATNRGGNDVFVTKLNAGGNALVYSTYLGGTVNSRVTGSGDDQGKGIAVDSSGNVYVAGLTSSTDFPVAGTLRPTYGGGTFDAFVFKLNPTGNTLAYSAYLGGSLEDQGNGIAIDTAGNAYVTGYTVSTNFPTVTPFQATNAGGAFDAFVTKVNAAGTAFAYSTYLGGNSGDEGNGIAVDASGNAYLTGSTPSTNFPTANAFQPSNSGMEQWGQSTDAFVTKLNPAGTGLVYSTYLGGNVPHWDSFGVYFASDRGLSIAVDASGSAYVAGSTGSTDFPTANAFQGWNPSYNDTAFVTKFDPSGSSLVYSTYLGGSSPGDASSIAVNSSGQAHVAGSTLASDFPTANALQSSLRTNTGGGVDPFITKLSSTGSSLIYSTYLGGYSEDHATGIALDSTGNAYVTGYTYSTDFPTSGAAQAANGGGQDAFVLKIADVVGYSISGRVTTVDGQSLAGVNVTLNGTQSSTAVTNSSGVYNFANLAQGGNFTVSPSLAPYTFVPPSRTFNNLSANQTGADFTIETYSINGRVTDAGGNGVGGVTVTISGSASASGVTNSTGNYSFVNFPQGANVTVTPSKTDILLTYNFTPPNRSYANLSSSQVADFTVATTVQSMLNPVADAYVQDGASAAANFGAATSLAVRTDSTINSGNNRDAYLKFDLNGVNRNITSARLRVYAALSAAGSVATSAYPVAATNWIESGTGGINWNNKPARGATALTGASATVNSTTFAAYDIDVTAYIKGEKSAGRDLVSLALHNPTATTITTNINSREAATNKPQLIISTSAGDNTPPAVSLTAPASGAGFTAPANITISASAADADGSISKVDFYAGTALIGTSTVSPYQMNWSNVATGNYSLSAVATDNFGATTNSAAAAVSVNPSNILPTVSMASPAEGTSFAAGSNVTVSASAADADGSVSKVEFFAGTTLIGTATAPTSGNLYSVVWGNVGSGTHAVTAKATDNANGSTTSAAVNISAISQTGLLSTADAYVRDGASAAANFGTAADLQAQASATAGNNRETYLKYDLTSVTGLTQARIRLYGRLNDTAATNVPVALHSVATTSWTETGITWNTKPVAGASPLASVTITNNVAQWYEWDVTAYVKAEKAAGRNVVSFVLKNTSPAATFTTFNSKEAAANQPQLILRTTQARSALLYTNSATLGAGDAAVRTRLQNLGFTVTVIAATKATAVTTAQADGKSIVLISSTVTPVNVANKFRHVAVPVVIWEFDLLDDQGMTGLASGTDFGTAATQTQLTITAPTHPMAAGLSGNVGVVGTASTFTWGKPSASAAKIATLTTDATKAVIFGYVGGVAMNGFEAPARRVALFMSDTTTGSFTTQGGALFDAAIKWATDTSTTPTITSLTPTSGAVSTTVTIRGVNFGSVQGTSTLTFNGAPATPTSWGDGVVTAAVPQFATTGPVVITVGGVASNGLIFAVGEADTDGDGLADNWELQHFGNLSQGASSDPDGDGLTNLQEFQQGRNPTKSALADSGDFVGLKVHTQLRP